MTNCCVDALVKARRRHQCVGCLTDIKPQETYRRMTWLGSGDPPYRAAYHVECRREEVVMNQRNGTHFDDEWTPLHEHVDECDTVADAELPPDVHDRFVERDFRRQQYA